MHINNITNIAAWEIEMQFSNKDIIRLKNCTVTIRHYTIIDN